MVQTRGQTRNGAPAPLTIKPFSRAIGQNAVNNPSRRRRRRPGVEQLDSTPPEPPSEEEEEEEDDDDDERPTGPRTYVLTGLNRRKGPRPPDDVRTLRGIFRAVPEVLYNVVSNITGLDMHNLIRALPTVRLAIRTSNTTDPIGCQDFPDHPMLKRGDPVNRSLLVFQQVRLPPPAPCTTPAAYPVLTKRCEGHALRYSGRGELPDHGPDFWVCQHCVQKAWEAYSVFVESRAIDLCRGCSRNFTRGTLAPGWPRDYPHQCKCLWNDRVWLCRTCRIAKADDDLNDAMKWIETKRAFAPMHGVGGQGVRPGHFVDPHSSLGESFCPCGLDVPDKIRSFQNPFDPTAQPQWGLLVRLCLYCRRQRFLTDRRFDST